LTAWTAPSAIAPPPQRRRQVPTQAALIVTVGYRLRAVRVSLSKGLAAFLGPDRLGLGGPGNLTPRLPQNPCATISRCTALAVTVVWRAGFTEAQWAKFDGR
jgi:hypothetical protein